ncbi:SIR2 family protein [Clostridium algidicarnis]|uniref:SIR2 family protein n=1 Tax=Clostridium algidicarnis TaxID=37659 RepID=UPI001C0E1D40|nr:SIR2 family protein [Clostridium algidicarnis]MBU3206973.1 SIR2 family protein [Clostridium algidicarnis]
MDTDEIKKEMQSFFDADTLTIVGSGLSLAEGIPGMAGLAEELTIKLDTMLTDTEDIRVWNLIKTVLSTLGLEGALQKYMPSHNLEEYIRKVTTEFIMEKEETVINEVISRKKILKIESYLKCFNIQDKGLQIITTNYDRLIEYACEINNIKIDNMFVGKYIALLEPKKSKNQFIKDIRKGGKIPVVEYYKRVVLYKPHGCLSWHIINGTPYSMPYSKNSDSLIITPGSNKYKAGYASPFDIQREQENASIDNASRYVTIGYGFNDEHLETHLITQIKKGKKILIVTYELSATATEIVNNYDNVYACYYGNEKGIDGTYVKIKKDKKFISGKELWDIEKLVEEVF